jgi:hypothetical protein
MHALELAKTYWNSVVVSEDMDVGAKEDCWVFLKEAKAILEILGPEGDPDGPLAEISTLETLLREGQHLLSFI